MEGGQWETSYINNSQVQSRNLEMVIHILKETLDTIQLLHPQLAKLLTAADLGCSCGRNTLCFVADAIVQHMTHLYTSRGHAPPEFSFYFSDLPSNDFNTLFRLLPPDQHSTADDGNNNGDRRPACPVRSTAGCSWRAPSTRSPPPSPCTGSPGSRERCWTRGPRRTTGARCSCTARRRRRPRRTGGSSGPTWGASCAAAPPSSSAAAPCSCSASAATPPTPPTKPPSASSSGRCSRTRGPISSERG